MILHRAFPFDPGARAREFGGALWFARPFQNAGRHDNPARYGCMYVAESEASVVSENLARWRGSGSLLPSFLARGTLTLGLAALELTEEARVVDLDDPAVLEREHLRPSEVATGVRRRTQDYALALYDRHPDAVALRWWSTLEASWANLTIFGRGHRSLRLHDVRMLTLDDPAVGEAAELLGLELP